MTLRLEDLKLPRFGRAGLLSAYINLIENKRDARAVAGFCAVAIAGIGALGGFIYSAYTILAAIKILDLIKSHRDVFAVLLVSISTLSVILLVFIFDRSRFKLRLMKYDRNRDFKIIQYVWGAVVDSRSHITYPHRIILSSKKNGTRKFHLPYSWSGSSDQPPEMKFKDPSVKGSIERRVAQLDKVIVVDLGRDIVKNEEVVIEFDFVTDTEGGQEPLPHLGLAITAPKYPKFNTFLGIAFAPGIEVASLRREVYFSPFSDHSLKSSVVELDGDRKHLWPIRPRLGFRYCLCWTYGGE